MQQSEVHFCENNSCINCNKNIVHKSSAAVDFSDLNIINMKCQIFTTTSIVLLSLTHFRLLHAAPMHSNDIDYNDTGTAGGGGGNLGAGHYLRNNYGNSNMPIDYNTIFAHVKDFFMYLPVMMTTLKETMNGFPKFAEGVRILTTKDARIESSDCNCDRGSSEVSNRQFG